MKKIKILETHEIVKLMKQIKKHEESWLNKCSSGNIIVGNVTFDVSNVTDNYPETIWDVYISMENRILEGEEFAKILQNININIPDGALVFGEQVTTPNELIGSNWHADWWEGYDVVFTCRDIARMAILGIKTEYFNVDKYLSTNTL